MFKFSLLLLNQTLYYLQVAKKSCNGVWEKDISSVSFTCLLNVEVREWKIGQKVHLD